MNGLVARRPASPPPTAAPAHLPTAQVGAEAGTRLVWIAHQPNVQEIGI